MTTEETTIIDQTATDTTTEQVESTPVATVAEATVAAAPRYVPPARTSGPRGNDRGPQGRGRGGSRSGGPRREARIKPEFDQKIIDIRRVTRVAAGGRRFSFAVSLVAGDRKGKIGVGTGKGGDTALAVEKAFRNAKKNMINLNLTKTGSISHEVSAKFKSARVEIMPAPGKGIAAGSSVRDVIDLAGVKDVVAKIRSGSKNKLNNAMVALAALSTVKKGSARRSVR